MPKKPDALRAGEFSACSMGDEQALALHVPKHAMRTLLDLLGSEESAHHHAEPGCTTVRMQEVGAAEFVNISKEGGHPHSHIFYAGGRHMLAEADAVLLDVWDRYEFLALDLRHTKGGPHIYVVTIPPFADHPSWTPALEARRQEWNALARGTDAYFFVIDADAMFRDPADHTRLNPLYDAGDHYLYNQQAHDLIGAAMYARIFRPY